MDTASATVYTPGGVVSAYDRAVSVAEEFGPVALRGVYVRTGTRQYGGAFYDRVREEHGAASIDIRVPAGLRAGLDQGSVCTLDGYLGRRVQDNGTIQVVFTVTGVAGQERPAADPVLERRQEVLQQHHRRTLEAPEFAIRRLFAAGERPKLGVLVGETAITDQDVLRALGSAADAYEVTWRRVSMGAPTSIADALRGMDAEGHTALAVVRGGGEGVQVFDDPDLAAAVVALGTPVLSAVGHQADHPFIEQVAARAFATPTALGAWLKLVADEAHEDAAHSRAALVKDVEAQSAGRLREVKVWAVVGAVAALVLGVVIGLLLR